MIACRDAVVADAETLRTVFVESFVATFGHLYAPADLAMFLDGMPVQAWRVQIGDPAFAFRIAEADDGAIAGFAKIGPVAFPGDWPADAVELYQLYVLGEHHGAGVGVTLMDWAIGAARQRGSSAMILSVYVDNHRARRFYERYGFVEVGRYTFMVGNHADDDRIMRLAL